MLDKIMKVFDGVGSASDKWYTQGYMLYLLVFLFIFFIVVVFFTK